eukprot:CAMPEP_0194086858 /NCGR_PEP_ID=MMETSP0149-20130528/22785_1 /TAXON_ID=122233 /ORGANISM="Chaetoceros debilis, Strain MM31A-1" /LENGTH=167 /DNA_ID=CAMNT_0038770063 /DNA_START=120 /DNA_END=623 /DNA_ORIENTATION=-
MDSSTQQLPLLPSERKRIVEKEKASSDGVATSPSPTRVSHLRITESEDSTNEVTSSLSRSKAALDDSTEAPTSSREENEQEDRAARDEHVQQFEDVPPLPASQSSTQLLRFMQATTAFLDSFAAQVDAKLTSCSDKIDRLEMKVNMLKTKEEKRADEHPRSVTGSGS